jgi:hypothetical protein
MPLYTFHCTKCNTEDERIWYPYQSQPVCCEVPMVRLFPGNQMVKMKGEGGYPSRRRQLFNTTQRNHPKLT